MKRYRVFDLRGGDTGSQEQFIQAGSPEGAVHMALGVDAVRGTSRYIKPVARVYWHDSPDKINMVRLYERQKPDA
ncbi:MAG: hypothetical protein EON56_01455 [Alphaproteobacteria bacterium]|nr:MAG: hypothetical protein EON56_01455 [Alphaproteobacteria bacterium]